MTAAFNRYTCPEHRYVIDVDFEMLRAKRKPKPGCVICKKAFERAIEYYKDLALLEERGQRNAVIARIEEAYPTL